jgi:peroxiredoxin Q/BCP
MIEEGKLAPDFTLGTDEGTEITLSKLRGKPVVLFFYPKADTPGCTIESCNFRDEIAAFHKKKAVVLGISKDNQKDQAKFREKYQLPFNLLCDVDSVVCNLYGVINDKNLYGKIVKGIERSTFIIDAEGKIAKIYRKVKVDGHVLEVLEEV